MQTRPSHSFAIGVVLLVLGYVAFFTVRAIDAQPELQQRDAPLPQIAGDPAVDRAIDKVASMPLPDLSALEGEPIALSATVKKSTPADRYSRWKQLLQKWEARGKPRKEAIGWVKIGSADLRKRDEWLLQRIFTSVDLNPQLRPLTNEQLAEFEFLVAGFRDQLDASGSLIARLLAKGMGRVFRSGIGLEAPRLEDPEFEQHIAHLDAEEKRLARRGVLQPNSFGYLSHHARGRRVYYHKTKLPDLMKAKELRASLSLTYAAGVIEWFHRHAILSTQQRNRLLENLGE